MSIFYELREKYPERFVFETKYFFVIEDGFPVSKGHLLIISKREVRDFFALWAVEQQDLLKAINIAKLHLDVKYSPAGYNIGMNCGEVAGQTVFHMHCHIWPRNHGDVPDPRGGVRNCMPRGNYLKDLPNG